MFLATVDGRDIVIRYDFAWVFQVMQASSTSLVPFSFFSERVRLLDQRSYPRSNNPGFTLWKEQLTESSSGGRRPDIDTSQTYALCELLGDEGRPIPLSDIAIMSKRAVCGLVRKNGWRHLQVLGGPLDHEDERLPARWAVHGYPMLCVMGNDWRSAEKSPTFPRDQAEWRVVQCVFGAVLTREIRRLGIGLEVISREGFGSLFPTIADLPKGIRLDPGLLPPDERGVEAIEVTLGVVDLFIRALQGEKMPPWIDRLNGFNDEALAGVDRLMSHLHEYTLKKPTAPGDAYAEHVASLTSNKASEAALPLPDNAEIRYGVPNALGLGEGTRVKPEPKYKDESGYGSESDYEDDVDEPEPQQVPKAIAIKKVSVITGMAALRMATLYAMAYSNWLHAKGGKHGTASEDNVLENALSRWAPYFELDPDKLFALLPHERQVGVRVLLFDGAPNPINIPDATPGTPLTDMGAVVVDTTNNTSQEKAAYWETFRECLVPQGVKGGGGLLILVDSGSKHPTGGDLVHGVIRICGPRRSVAFFIDQLLDAHHGKFGNKDQSTLSYKDTGVRKEMNRGRLVMRNKDLWRWLPRGGRAPEDL
jgi:hypothetical protein